MIFKIKDIRTFNNKGQLHGYQERYGILEKKLIRYTAKNGRSVGYTEWHNAKLTKFCIK